MNNINSPNDFLKNLLKNDLPTDLTSLDNMLTSAIHQIALLDEGAKKIIEDCIKEKNLTKINETFESFFGSKSVSEKKENFDLIQSIESFEKEFEILMDCLFQKGEK